jgi:hypothetical protein
LILTGPNQQVATYCLAAVWGCGTGWKWTNDRLIASTIIPVGQDTELMGTYLFAGQCLTWLPPLLYTALNEAGVKAQYSLCSLGAWFLLGILALLKVGDYTTAVRAAGRGYVLERRDDDDDQEAEEEEQIVGGGIVGESGTTTMTSTNIVTTTVPPALEQAESKETIKA